MTKIYIPTYAVAKNMCCVIENQERSVDGLTKWVDSWKYEPIIKIGENGYVNIFGNAFLMFEEPACCPMPLWHENDPSTFTILDSELWFYGPDLPNRITKTNMRYGNTYEDLLMRQASQAKQKMIKAVDFKISDLICELDTSSLKTLLKRI